MGCLGLILNVNTTQFLEINKFFWFFLVRLAQAALTALCDEKEPP